MSEYHCYKCGYEWEIRKEKPKSCPRCKTRLDYVLKEKIDHTKEQEMRIKDETKEAQADLAKDDPETRMEEWMITIEASEDMQITSVTYDNINDLDILSEMGILRRVI